MAGWVGAASRAAPIRLGSPDLPHSATAGAGCGFAAGPLAWTKLTPAGLSVVIAALAISGIPPLAGFWSKDDILSSLLAQGAGNGGRFYLVLWALGLLTAAPALVLLAVRLGGRRAPRSVALAAQR